MFLLQFMLVLLFVAAAAAAFELSVIQLFIIGTIASVVLQILKVISAKFNWKPSTRVVTLIGFIISVAMAYFWTAPTLPPITDPMEFSKALLEAATGVIGAAMVIYNVLLKALLEKAQEWTKITLTT
jgi:hypothetical protein